MSEILTLGINWVRFDGEPSNVYVGDRFICIVPARSTGFSPLQYTVEIIEATEDGWANEFGFTIFDCVAWCREGDIHEAAVRVFGEPESEAE